MHWVIASLYDRNSRHVLRCDGRVAGVPKVARCGLARGQLMDLDYVLDYCNNAQRSVAWSASERWQKVFAHFPRTHLCCSALLWHLCRMFSMHITNNNALRVAAAELLLCNAREKANS